MRLSTTSAHAALAMAFLAKQDEGATIQAFQVAAHLGVSTASALKVLHTLVRRGLIGSRPGRNGGYGLRKTVDQMSLLQIVEAIDGPIDSQSSFSATEESMAGVAVLQSVCDGVARSVRKQLAQTTVADIAKAPAACANQTLRLVG
jgi:Rrf2 family protein